jgi:hypothetical protein
MKTNSTQFLSRRISLGIIFLVVQLAFAFSGYGQSPETYDIVGKNDGDILVTGSIPYPLNDFTYQIVSFTPASFDDPAIIYYNSGNPNIAVQEGSDSGDGGKVSLFKITKTDGGTFSVTSIRISNLYGDNFIITGYNDGTDTGQSEDVSAPFSGDVGSIFSGVDELRFEGSNISIDIDDFVYTLDPVNTAPTATAPSAPTVVEDDTNIALADDIQVADTDTDDQTVAFTITGGTLTVGTADITFDSGSNGSSSFTAAGTLSAINTALDAATFTPTPNLSGTGVAEISFTTSDGTDTSDAASVTIHVAVVNDEPSFTIGANQTLVQNAGAQIVNGFATDLDDGDGGSQTVSFNVSNDNTTLFAVQPAISSTGVLTYTPDATKYGKATVTVSIVDDGGVTNGGDNQSPNQTFTIFVTPTSVVINELNAAPGTEEFVELYNSSGSSAALDGLVLVFFNGDAANDATYKTAIELDGKTIAAGDYFVIGDAEVANQDLSLGGVDIQDGVDAVALYVGDQSDFPTGTAVSTQGLVDAIVYHTGQADDTDLINILTPGQSQVNENSNGDKARQSSQRIPNGSGGLRNTSTFLQYSPTPGERNNATPTASNFTASPIYQNTIYTFATTGDFGYIDGDSDPLNHIRITAVPGSGDLFFDSDQSGTPNAGDILVYNSFTITKTDLDAGKLIYENISGISSSFTFDVNDGTDYSVSTYTATLSVYKTPTITFSNITKTYGDANFNFGATVNSGGTISYSIQAAANGTSLSGTNNVTATLGNAGTVTIRATAAANGAYASGTKDITLTINKATLTATAVAASKTYGDTNPSLTFTYGAFKNSETSAVIDTEPTASTTATTTTGAGTATIAVSGGSDNNYIFDYTSANLMINKARLTATATAASKIYGDANPSLTFTYGAFKNSETSAVLDTEPTASTSATASTGAGIETIALSGGSDNNYSFDYTSANLTINKKALSAVAENKSREYGDANPAFTILYGAFVGSDTSSDLDIPPSASTTAIATTAVGTATITLSAGSDDNYTITPTNGTLMISKATLTATAIANSRAYGDANPSLTFTYGAFKNSETSAVIDTEPTASTTATTTTGAGTATITVSGGSDNNYSFDYTSANLTINKARLTATAVAASKTYGDANPSLTFTYGAFKNSEISAVLDTEPIASTSATAATGAGIETIALSGGSDNNYSFDYTSANLTINKKALSAVAENKSREYGDANPAFTILYGSFVGSDTSSDLDTPPSASTTAIATTAVGTATITLSAGSDDNYTITSTNGILTISKATLTATAVAASKTYGDVNPSLTFTYGAFKNSETSAVLDTEPTASTSATASTGAGIETIALSGGSDNNYTFDYTSANLTINKARLTATAVAASKIYGDANPSLTFTYGAFKNSETLAVLDTEPTASTSATAATGAGTETIAVSGGSDNNYSFDYTSANLTINKKALSAVAENKSREYGDANPAFTILYGSFVGSDTSSDLDTPPSASTTAIATTAVGTATITLSAGSDDNYTITSTNGILTISKATLIATAVAASKTYGDVNPSLTFTYGAFKNSETLAVLDTEPTASTTATTTTGAGTATITVSGGSDNNYSFDYTSANLMINKATLTVTTWPTASGITYGQDLSSAILSGGTASVVGSFAYDDSTIIPNTGTYSADIVFTPTDATNYITVAGNVDVIVNKEATITTQAVSDITVTSAIANGNITDLGVPNPTSYGVCWSTSENPTTVDSKDDKGAASATGAFTSSISSLSSNTTYYVRAFVTNSAGTVYGEQMIFSTLIANDYTPFITANQSFDVDENAANNISVGTVLVTDADASTSYSSWAIIGGNEDAIFAIHPISGVITVVDNANLDFETMTSYILSVTVSDGTNISSVETVSINVNDINDELPVVTASQSFIVNEDALNDASVGTVLVTDADASTSYSSWAIIGGNEDAILAINPTSGVITVADNTNLDFETAVSYTLGISVSDGVQTSLIEDVIVYIINVNDNLPVVTANQRFFIDEDAANNTSFGTVLANDADAGTTYSSWSITGGNDDAIFAINPATAKISIVDNSNLNFETSSTYTLGISVSDGIHISTTEDVFITITDVNERPVANAGENQIVADNSTVELNAWSSYDPDGDYLDFVWSAPEGIELSNVHDPVPTFTAPDVSTLTDYVFTLIVNDGELYSEEVSVTISVDNVTGIEEVNSEEVRVSLYPNPSKGKFYIELNKRPINAVTLSIISLSGQAAYSQKLYKKKTFFNLSLKSGMYILKIVLDDKIIMKKIIIHQD